MTENEAIIEEANEIAKGRMYATKALIECQKELEAYRVIGTIDEFKALKEKSVAKKPDFTEDKQFALCPNISCNSKGLKDKQKYCDCCGQKLDWE